MKHNTDYFCSPEGVFTLEKLFKKNKVKILRRTINSNGHAVFYLHPYWNPRTGTGCGWKLTNPETVMKAIKLAKKHNLELYGSST